MEGQHPKQAAIDAANYLLNVKDLSKNASIGVAAPLYYESGMKPGPQGTQSTEHGGVLNPHGAYGVASWNGPADQSKVGDPAHDRQAALAEFAQKKNLPVESVETQLDFVLNEAANHYPKTWDAITSSRTLYRDIIPVFVAEYENPADHKKETDAALAIADEIAPFIIVAQAPPTAPAEPPEPIPPTATPPPSGHVVDKELLAIDACYAIINDLEDAARHRVLVYLYSRFVP